MFLSKKKKNELLSFVLLFFVHRNHHHLTSCRPFQGEELQKRIGAKRFIECSALTQENLSKVFEDSVRVYKEKMLAKTDKKKKGDKDCIVM